MENVKTSLKYLRNYNFVLKYDVLYIFCLIVQNILCIIFKNRNTNKQYFELDFAGCNSYEIKSTEFAYRQVFAAECFAQGKLIFYFIHIGRFLKLTFLYKY